jgi:Mlc titration factor MtfA (ptsG expression regulator)
VAILFIAGVAALFIAVLLAQPALRERRRRRLRAAPFPAEWRAILRRRFPAHARLPFPERRELERRVQVFVAEKDFIGCAGQEIDDEVRVTIAAQACLIRLGRPGSDFPRLSSILVYPGAFVVERVRPEPSGVLQETRHSLSGESWTNGQVVLSWDDVLAGAANPADGRNVVIHEFAHQLDQERGRATGAPFLGHRARYPRWAAVMGGEFRRLHEALARGEPTLLSPYAATEPAEFFAVASEVFFERPREMAELHGALYQELARYYAVNPLAWQG